MDLIIKPTEACNFKCTFCSSTDIAPSKAINLDLKKIYAFLERYPDTRTIIVNGGDPLIMAPEYYFELLSYIRKRNLPTTLSLTTNLWDFYKNPDKWTELFKHKKVGISTSFNYGDTRRITKNKIFSEDIFWNVSNLFLEKVGYRPSFISVINDDNAYNAIDNVYLAKKMDVECKLNYAMASGIQSKPFVLSKIYEIYVQIYKAGLTPWEFNTKQMLKRMVKAPTICPQNRTCDSNIRCLQPAGDYYSCGAFGDDKEYSINFEEEVILGEETKKPLADSSDIFSLKSECLSCPMFEICNGCKKTIKDLQVHQLVEDHCVRMKRIAPDIVELQEHTYESLQKIKDPTFTFEY